MNDAMACILLSLLLNILDGVDLRPPWDLIRGVAALWPVWCIKHNKNSFTTTCRYVVHAGMTLLEKPPLFAFHWLAF